MKRIFLEYSVKPNSYTLVRVPTLYMSIEEASQLKVRLTLLGHTSKDIRILKKKLVDKRSVENNKEAIT